MAQMRYSSPDVKRTEYNLSFAGCGFLGIYHVGVAAAIREYAPDLVFNQISGASAGAMAAVCLISGAKLNEMACHLLAASVECRSHIGGAFNPYFNISQIIEEKLYEMLPENIHEMVNGKLHVSVTRVYDGQNVIINNFVSKKEVVDAVVASTFIPLFSGFIPYRYRGVRVIDGGFSDNIPKLNESTITVSPFAGDSSICPQDTQRNKMLHRLYLAEVGHNITVENISRLVNVLFPPQTAVLAELCSEGFRDAVSYLQRNDMISCTRCLCISSILTKGKKGYLQSPEENGEEGHDNRRLSAVSNQEEHDADHTSGNEHDDCRFCQQEIEEARKAELPIHFSQVMQDMIGKADSNLKQRSYLYKYLWPIISYTPPVIVARWALGTSLFFAGKAYSVVQNRIPALRDDEKLFQLVESVIVSLLKKFSQIHEVPADGGQDDKTYFTCDVNLTQFGQDDERQEYSLDSSDNVDARNDEENKRGSIGGPDELLTVEITSVIENGDLKKPSNQNASKFQADNLYNAVHAHAANTYINSRRGSLAVTEMLSAYSSRQPSRQPSRQASRQISRRSSISNIMINQQGGIAAQDPLNQIIDISENEKTVFEMHYRNKTGDLITVAMYDVSNQDHGAQGDGYPGVSGQQQLFDPSLVKNRLLQEQLRLGANDDDNDEDDLEESYTKVEMLKK